MTSPTDPPGPVSASTTANPLFVTWLTEWLNAARSDAAVNGAASKLPFTYKRALDNMKQYPDKLPSGTAASRVKYVGPKIAERLQARLESHLNDHPDERADWPAMSTAQLVGAPLGNDSGNATAISDPAVPLTTAQSNNSTSKPPRRNAAARSRHPPPIVDTLAPEPTRSSQPSQSKRMYVPRYRSGAYAILIALYNNASSSSTSGFMTKNDLIAAAQPYADASFTVSVAAQGMFATAWGSMLTLTKKDLVYRMGVPHRFALTEEGRDLAASLVQLGSTGGNRPRSADTAVISSNDLIGRSSITNSISETVSSSNHKHRHHAQSNTTQYGFIYVDEHGIGVTQKHLSTIKICETTGQTRLKIRFKPGCLPDQIRHHVYQQEIVSPEIAVGFIDDAHAPELLDEDDMNCEVLAGTATAATYSAPASTLQAEPTSQSQPQQLVCFPAGTYDIVLVLDSREIIHRSHRRYFQDELDQLGVTVTTRSLPLGDMLWVARRKPARNGPASSGSTTIVSSSSYSSSIDEIVLDYIVERKLLDDLVASIKDDRYNEQKFRLANSGITNVIYLVEDGQRSDAQGFGLDRIMSAMSRTMVNDGFFLKCTASAHETVLYLRDVTRAIEDVYRGCDLRAVRAIDVSKDKMGWRGITQRHAYQHDGARDRSDGRDASKRVLLTFEAYSGLNSKSDGVSLGDVWKRQLMCIRGVNGDKASAIASVYPTPGEFFRALDAERDDQRRIEVIRRAGAGGAHGRGAIGASLARTILDTLRP